jgi:CheY-like chemotaxis protein
VVIIDLFKETLKGSGCGLLSATKGSDGLNIIESSDVDLVFLDLKMPEINGAELFRRIKMIRPNLPVVIMTGYPNSDLMDQALMEGPFGLMKKPIGEREIKAAIRSFSLGVSARERSYHENNAMKPEARHENHR